MGAEVLSSRAIIGEFYKALEQDAGASWVSLVASYFTSDQDSESYPWLGQVPQMREWVGGRHAKGFTDNGIQIANKHFEATIEVLVKDLRRDKSTQVMARIRELAQRTNAHWAKLHSALILNGGAGLAYDGQYFFDTDHAEGESGAQSNDIQVDISALPASAHGVVSAPGIEEIQQAIMAGINKLVTFVDDRGEPMNETAQQFLVMTPPNLMLMAQSALAMPSTVSLVNSNIGNGMQIGIVGNARLSTWTDKFVVFRTDSNVKALISQEETGVQLKAKAEGSEFEFDNDAHQYGVDTWRNVGYGMWQNAVRVTMI